MEDSMELSQKIKNRTAIWYSNFILNIYLRKTKTLIQKDMCPSIVQGSITYGSNQSIHGSMDEENVKYVYNGILFRH